MQRLRKWRSEVHIWRGSEERYRRVILCVIRRTFLPFFFSFLSFFSFLFFWWSVPPLAWYHSWEFGVLRPSVCGASEGPGWNGGSSGRSGEVGVEKMWMETIWFDPRGHQEPGEQLHCDHLILMRIRTMLSKTGRSSSLLFLYEIADSLFI